MEMGTQNKGDIDFDWIPKETLNEISKLSIYAGHYDNAYL